jgi:hypothetical protein
MDKKVRLGRYLLVFRPGYKQHTHVSSEQFTSVSVPWAPQRYGSHLALSQVITVSIPQINRRNRVLPEEAQLQHLPGAFESSLPGRPREESLTF